MDPDWAARSTAAAVIVAVTVFGLTLAGLYWLAETPRPAEEPARERPAGQTG
jgi:uncharacterized membrane protein YfbV (UPF0208 family)